MAMVIGIAALLGACGGGSGQASDTTTSATALRQATAAQIASIVAKEDAGIRAAAAKAKACQFLDSPRCDLVGLLAVQELGSRSKTLALGLDSADDDRPNNGLFVGIIPEEIRSLVAATVSYATGVGGAVDDFAAKGCLPKAGVKNTSTECGGASLSLVFLGDELIHQLDAWQPYL